MPPLTEIDRLPVGDGAEAARFCSRCGAGHQSASEPRASDIRVCDACGMGVLLQCSSSALPGQREMFLIVTSDLRVSAVSETAEPVFGIEEKVLGQDVRELLSCPLGDDAFAQRISQAAVSATEPTTMPACCKSEAEAGGGMMAAKIATCGPPRAALVAVEPSPFSGR
jgi:hypothetical protein